MSSTETNTIIDQFFLVGLRKSPPSDQPTPPKNNKPQYQPYIKESWPDTPEVRANQNRVPLFCFPEDIDQYVNAHLNNTSGSAQSVPNSSWGTHFAFVFTDVSGKKQFGFCRRIAATYNKGHARSRSRNIPVNAPVNVPDEPHRSNSEQPLGTPDCICVLTHHPWFSFQYKLLEIIEERYLVGTSAVTEFVNAVLQYSPFPAPGQTFTVKINLNIDDQYYRNKGGARNVPAANQKKYSILPNEYDFVRPTSRALLFDVNFRPMFDSLSLSNILSLFGALLEEYHIILYSKDLTKVSDCAHAAIGMILPPFSWQSIYIPVLPKSLVEYCMAPVPYLIGVHSSTIPLLKKMPIEGIVFVDLDTDTVQFPEVEEPNAMSSGYGASYATSVLSYQPSYHLPDPSNKLRSSLEKILQEAQRTEHFDQEGIIKSFQSWFTMVFQTYTQYLKVNSDKINEIKFDRDEFIQGKSHSKAVRKFLETFTTSQMFERFIAKIEENPQTASRNFFMEVQSITEKSIPNEAPGTPQKKLTQSHSYSGKGWDAINSVVLSDTAHMLSEKASAFSGIAKERYTDLKKYASDKLATKPSTHNPAMLQNDIDVSQEDQFQKNFFATQAQPTQPPQPATNEIRAEASQPTSSQTESSLIDFDSEFTDWQSDKNAHNSFSNLLDNDLFSNVSTSTSMITDTSFMSTASNVSSASFFDLSMDNNTSQLFTPTQSRDRSSSASAASPSVTNLTKEMATLSHSRSSMDLFGSSQPSQPSRPLRSSNNAISIDFGQYTGSPTTNNNNNTGSTQFKINLPVGSSGATNKTSRPSSSSVTFIGAAPAPGFGLDSFDATFGFGTKKNDVNYTVPTIQPSKTGGSTPSSTAAPQPLQASKTGGSLTPTPSTTVRPIQTSMSQPSTPTHLKHTAPASNASDPFANLTTDAFNAAKKKPT